MSAKSNYLESAVINHVLRNIAYTPPATIYIGLFTVIPTEAGVYPNYGGTEVSGGSYTRMSIPFSSLGGGAVTNSTDVTFPIATGIWGNIVAFALLDDPTAGNMLYYGNFTTPKQINTSDILTILSGQLTVSEL